MAHAQEGSWHRQSTFEFDPVNPRHGDASCFLPWRYSRIDVLLSVYLWSSCTPRMSCCGGIHYSIALLALHSAEVNLVQGCEGQAPGT